MGKLRKLHKLFAHPRVTKLHDLLRTSTLQAITSKTLQLLQYILSTCKLCRKSVKAPKHYLVIMETDNMRFNEKVYIEIIYIKGTSVLRMEDDAKQFSEAKCFIL